MVGTVQVDSHAVCTFLCFVLRPFSLKLVLTSEKLSMPVSVAVKALDTYTTQEILIPSKESHSSEEEAYRLPGL